MWEMRRGETRKWVPTEESVEAFEAIKSLGSKLTDEGMGDSPISRFIKLFVEEVDRTRFYN